MPCKCISCISCTKACVLQCVHRPAQRAAPALAQVVLGYLHRHLRHLPQQPVRAQHRVPGQPHRWAQAGMSRSNGAVGGAVPAACVYYPVRGSCPFTAPPRSPFPCCRRCRPPWPEHCLGHLRPRVPPGLHPALAQDALRLPAVQQVRPGNTARSLQPWWVDSLGCVRSLHSVVYLGPPLSLRVFFVTARLQGMGVFEDRAHRGRQCQRVGQAGWQQQCSLIFFAGIKSCLCVPC